MCHPTKRSSLRPTRFAGCPRLRELLFIEVIRQFLKHQGLASEANCSRSVLAERFSRVIGVPPMKYLSQWRLFGYYLVGALAVYQLVAVAVDL